MKWLCCFNRIANATFCISIYVGTRCKQAPELPTNEDEWGAFCFFIYGSKSGDFAQLGDAFILFVSFFQNKIQGHPHSACLVSLLFQIK